MLHTISWKEYFTLMGLLLVLYYGWLLVRYYPGMKISGKGKADRGRQVLPDFVTLKAAGGSGVASGAVVKTADGDLPAGKAGSLEPAGLVMRVEKSMPAEKPGLEKAGVQKEQGEKGGARVAAGAGEVIGKPDQAMPASAQGIIQMELLMSAAEATGAERVLPVPAVIGRPLLLPELAGDLMNELYRVLERAKDGEMPVQGLLLAVEQLLKQETYSRLRGTSFEGKISAQIVRELERHGSIHVDAEEVKGWWK